MQVNKNLYNKKNYTIKNIIKQQLAEIKKGPE